MAKVGDKFILHSANGMDYKIEIVNVNYYREPSMWYACDVTDENGVSSDDVIFCGDDVINKCEKVGMTEQEIKAFVSKEFLKGIPDYAIQTVLRRVLYDKNNRIDWQDFYEQILYQMPEYTNKSYKERRDEYVSGNFNSIC